MTTDVQRPREALLLFAQQLELDVCAESLRNLTHSRFRAERLGSNPRDARARAHHLLGDALPAAVLLLGSAAWLGLNGPPQDAAWARELRREGAPTLRPSLRISSGELTAMPFVPYRLVTTPRPVLDEERADELANLGADMVDQVAYGVVEACIDREAECAVVLMVRGIAGIQQPDDRAGLEQSMRRLAVSVAPLIQWIDRREARRFGRKSG